MCVVSTPGFGKGKRVWEDESGCNRGFVDGGRALWQRGPGRREVWLEMGEDAVLMRWQQPEGVTCCFSIVNLYGKSIETPFILSCE